MMDAVDDDNFGAVLDTAHQNAQKEILALSVEKLGKRIFFVHAADNDGRVNDHVAAGRGTVDWDGVFQGLKKHRFSRSEEHTSELQSRLHLVCRLLLEKKKTSSKQSGGTTLTT